MPTKGASRENGKAPGLSSRLPNQDLPWETMVGPLLSRRPPTHPLWQTRLKLKEDTAGKDGRKAPSHLLNCPKHDDRPQNSRSSTSSIRKRPVTQRSSARSESIYGKAEKGRRAARLFLVERQRHEQQSSLYNPILTRITGNPTVESYGRRHPSQSPLTMLGNGVNHSGMSFDFQPIFPIYVAEKMRASFR
jgi:hypothetical protein